MLEPAALEAALGRHPQVGAVFRSERRPGSVKRGKPLAPRARRCRSRARGPDHAHLVAPEPAGPSNSCSALPSIGRPRRCRTRRR